MITFTWYNVFRVDLNVIEHAPILVLGSLVAVKLYYPRSSPDLAVARFLFLPINKAGSFPQAGFAFLKTKRENINQS